jgi:hypothetical protein
MVLHWKAIVDADPTESFESIVSTVDGATTWRICRPDGVVVTNVKVD